MIELEKAVKVLEKHKEKNKETYLEEEKARAEKQALDKKVKEEKKRKSDLAKLAKSVEQKKAEALAVVEQHHQRIANTIRTLWGYKECSVYINKLIMNGGDGMGNARSKHVCCLDQGD